MEKLDGIKEGALFDNDSEINGVEVSLASKASSEISFWINGGVELRAERASKSQQVISVNSSELEMLYDKLRDGNVISEVSQLLSRDRAHFVFLVLLFGRDFCFFEARS